MTMLSFQPLMDLVDTAPVFPTYGHVTNLSGVIIEGFCESAVVGAIAEIYSLDRRESFHAEVIGFRADRALFMPLGEVRGIGMGSRIALRQKAASVRVGPQLVGRVLDALLKPLDGGPPPECEEEFSIYAKPVNPLKRDRIKEPLDIGVKAINGLLTVGKGQRIAIMSGSGVGKSMLLGQMARSTKADINVIAMIGERGREVREFLERDLGPEGVARSVVICATSDSSPVLRIRAAFVAATIAEYFRKQGKSVLMLMDSVTRFAMAQREIGLSAGEPPTTKGYPPSVFTLMPKLCERAGNTSSGGSITGIFTVLVEGDDINDPIGDTVRSIVDGHIFLNRKIAAKNQFPAIDVPYSASRVMSAIVPKEHMQIAGRIRTIIANYTEAEDLINIGAYVKGSNPAIDEAVQYIDAVKSFLKQDYDKNYTFEESSELMRAIFAQQPQPAPQARQAGRR